MTIRVTTQGALGDPDISGTVKTLFEESLLSGLPAELARAIVAGLKKSASLVPVQPGEIIISTGGFSLRDSSEKSFAIAAEHFMWSLFNQDWISRPSPEKLTEVFSGLRGDSLLQ